LANIDVAVNNEEKKHFDIYLFPIITSTTLTSQSAAKVNPYYLYGNNLKNINGNSLENKLNKISIEINNDVK